MLDKVKYFYKKLPGYSRNREISVRLQGAVAKAMRSSFYELKINFSDFESIFKKHLLTSFVDSRIFEKATKAGGTKECFDVAERITRELWNEFKNKSQEEVWKFFESFIKLYEVEKTELNYEC